VTPVGAVNRVTFFSDGNPVGTAAVSATTGLATLNVSNLLPGKHELTVDYQGDAHYEPSTSSASPYSQVVNSGPSSVTMTTDVNPSKYGQQVTLTATVTPSDASGTVEFFTGATSLGTATLSGGVASLATTALPVGTQ